MISRSWSIGTTWSCWPSPALSRPDRSQQRRSSRTRALPSMTIESAIQQYLTALKERASREQVEFGLVVLARLQEYLEGDAALDSAESIRADDLRQFVRDWYRAREDVTPEVAQRLVGALLEWAGWLDAHLDRSTAAPIR